MNVSVTPAAPRRNISVRLLAALLPALLSAALGSPAARAAEPLVAVAGAVPPTALLRSAHLLGRQSQDAPVTAGLILPLRNQDELHTLLHSLSDPKSPQYGHYLSADEFTRRFSPTQADYDAVVSFARVQGLTVQPHAGRTLVGISGASGDVERAFNVHLNQYRTPEGRVAYANDAAPLVPASVAARISGVVGLDNILTVKPQIRRRVPDDVQEAVRSLGATPNASPGSDPSGGLTPADIKAVYNLSNVTYQGEGQNVAIIAPGGGYYLGDIGAYVAAYGLPTDAGAFVNVGVNYPNGSYDGTIGPNYLETILDLDMIISLAPRVSHIFVYIAPDSSTVNTLGVLASAADADQAQVISYSYGLTENVSELADIFTIYQALFNAQEQIYERMGAQGQSIFVAAGDNGAYDDGVELSVSGDASPPSCTAVGGTTLATNGSGLVAPYAGESAWGDPTEPSNTPGDTLGAGGGGGVSNFWAKPAYQYADSNHRIGPVGVGIPPTSLGTTGTTATALMRDLPDVALNADPATGYAIYSYQDAPGNAGGFANDFIVVGGTSAASPLWAAFTVLVNEGRALGGAAPISGVTPNTAIHPVGFANPLIYAIGYGQYSNYNNDFNDVTTGNNLFYPARRGYDDATGWGSFNGANLLLAMISVTGVTNTGSVTTGGVAVHRFGSGLQMISAPYDFSGTGDDFAGLFGLTTPLTSNEPKLYEYLGQLAPNPYASYPTPPADTLRPGIGYWLRAPATGANLLVTGATVSSPKTITLQTGWNQIGDPFVTAEPLSNMSVATTAGAAGTPVPQAGNLIYTTLYTRQSGDTNYVAETNALQPYYGYWIYAMQPLFLTYTQAGSGFGGPPLP